jgi:hypothetical protein
MAVVSAVAGETPAEDAGSEVEAPVPSLEEARARRSTRWLPFAAAAAVLVAAGWFVWRQAPSSGSGSERDALEVAAATLARTRPDLVADLPVLTDRELAGGGHGVLRGGIYLHGPNEIVLDDRPTFSWEYYPTIDPYEIALFDSTGARLWTRTAPARGQVAGEIHDTWFEFPKDEAPLKPGTSYRWTVSGTGAFGQIEGSRTFSRASEADAAKWAQTVEASKAVSPGSRSLLLGHLALRRGYLDEAMKHLREPGEAGRSPLATASWKHLLRRLGVREPEKAPGR